MDQLVHEVIDQIRQREQQPELPTGLARLDEAIWGLHRTEVTVLAARPGEGKCLAAGTPVMMADGEIRAVELVRVGDALMGPDSHPRHITSITTGTEPLYEIQQRNGLWYTVNASHILALESTGETTQSHYRGRRTSSRYSIGRHRTISVRDYAASNAKFKQTWLGYKVPVEFPSQAVPIAPYLLGLWLGDGDSAGTRFTLNDPELVEALHEQADKLEALRDLELIQNKHIRDLELIQNKHIPSCYSRNDRATRLQLLAGLIDSDGARNNRGLIFYNTNRRLAEDTTWLCRSLGLRAQCHPYTWSLTREGITKTGPAYKVTIGGELSRIPTRLARKHQPDSVPRRSTRTAFRVVPKGVGRYYGFTLAEPDGLFLLGDCTVTHNTTMALQMAGHLANLTKRVLFLSLEMNVHQIIERWLIQLTHTNAWQLRTGHSPTEFFNKLESLNGYFQELSLRCLDDLGVTASEVTDLLNEMAKGKGPPDVLFVDFIQLIESEEEGVTDMEAIKRYLRSLKRLAKRYNMAVVVCSQINREGGRSGKLAPKLIHLKGSGALEELADCVLMLWWQELGTEEEPQGTKYWVCVEKQRYGPPGQKVPLQFDKEYLTFLAAEQPVSEWPAPQERQEGEDPTE